MADYISKEELIKALEADYNREWNGSDEYVEGARNEYDDVLTIICGIPTTDVQPVKHGKLEETHISICKLFPKNEKEKGHIFYLAEMKCSCCGNYNNKIFSLSLNRPNFCQHCGARMDGE